MQNNTVATMRGVEGAKNVFYTGVGNLSGEYPTRTHVKAIERPALTGLAAFLAEHVYNTSNHRGALMVRAYNDNKTEGDLMRESGRPNAAGFVRMYDLDSKPACINDWLFPLFTANDTPESFWTRAAAQMVAAGVTRVAVCAPLKPRVEYVL